MNEEIKEWLENPDYKKGVKLYSKYGKDQTMLSLFRLPETSFTHGQLVKAMEAMLPKVPEPEKELKPVIPRPVLDLIRKRSLLHGSLSYTTGKEDRYLIAKTILAISRKLDRYFDDGQLPDDHPENETGSSLPTNAWELHMLLNNNTAYLAKNRKREDKQGEVKRRERQNTSIEERLKEMNHGPIS